jgi:hypothetical protein
MTTRVVLDRGLDPFARLTTDERRRLMVRVLCELVAYGAPDEQPATAPDPLERIAG